MADEPRSIIPPFPPGDPDEPIPIPPVETQPDIRDPNTGTSVPPDGTQVIEPDDEPGPPSPKFEPPKGPIA